jgi:cytochrome c oxidase subunit II
MARTRQFVAAAVGALLAASAASADDHARGRELFQLCAQCHGPEGGGDQMALAPDIAGMPAWYVAAQLKNFRNGVRGLHPNDTAGLRMYPMSLSLRSDADIEAVASYVASLPKPKPAVTVDGDASKGQALFQLCAACHGAQGAGNQQMNAPRLAGTSDWYLLSTLQKFKTGVRGSNPKNTNAVLMRGFASQLPDEQAMRDVVSYINTLD